MQLNHTAQSQARFKEFKDNHPNVTIAPYPGLLKLNTTLANSTNETDGNLTLTQTYNNITLAHNEEGNLTAGNLTKNRAERMAVGAVAPLITLIGPHVSTFMSKLIGPLIKGVANHPNSDPYKDQLIQRFTNRAFQGTSF